MVAQAPKTQVGFESTPLTPKDIAGMDRLSGAIERSHGSPTGVGSPSAVAQSLEVSEANNDGEQPATRVDTIETILPVLRGLLTEALKRNPGNTRLRTLSQAALFASGNYKPVTYQAPGYLPPNDRKKSAGAE